MNEIAGAAHRGASITPSPYANRCALSEAWYRALYAAHPRNASSPAVDPPAAHSAQTVLRGASAPSPKSAHTPLVRIVSATAHRQRPAFAVASAVRVRGDRLAPPTRAAREWRAALARRTACRLALPDGGSVDLLFEQRGLRLRVVAVTAGPALPIGAALQRARAVLAAHGLRLEIDVRQKGSA